MAAPWSPDPVTAGSWRTGLASTASSRKDPATTALGKAAGRWGLLRLARTGFGSLCVSASPLLLPPPPSPPPAQIQACRDRSGWIRHGHPQVQVIQPLRRFFTMCCPDGSSSASLPSWAPLRGLQVTFIHVKRYPKAR